MADVYFLSGLSGLSFGSFFYLLSCPSVKFCCSVCRVLCMAVVEQLGDGSR